MVCPAVLLLSCCAAPMLALGATGGLGGGLGFGASLREGVSLGGGGLGAGTGAEAGEETLDDGGVSVGDCGFGATKGLEGAAAGFRTQGADSAFDSSDRGSRVSCATDSDTSAVRAPSSQKTLLDGLEVCETFLGFGATVGGADFAGWRRGRGRGSGFFVTTKSLWLVSPQLPSATCCCCSNACILAFSAAMSSSSSSSSLSDWLCPLLSLC